MRTIFPNLKKNANFQIFFKSSNNVVRQLYSDFASVDMPLLKEFQEFCKSAWDRKYGFIVIDFSRDYNSGNKYRSTLELNTEF